MTDDKRPREWWIHSTGNSYTRDVSSQFPVVHVIEKSAYDALALRLKEAEEENKVLSERFVSKTEYDDLEKENDQLRAEVELLKSRLAHFQNLHKEFHDQLTREREITAMLREALIEACSCGRVHAGWCPQCKALAREKEMRK